MRQQSAATDAARDPLPHRPPPSRAGQSAPYGPARVVAGATSASAARNLLHMQRSVGNRAVAGLRAQRRPDAARDAGRDTGRDTGPAGAPSVQRCGDHPCAGDCAATEPSTENEPAPVQRLSLGGLADRAGAAVGAAAAGALPSGLLEALGGARGKADAADDGADRASAARATEATAELGAVPQQVQGQLDAAGRAGTGAVAAQAGGARQQEQAVRGSALGLTREGGTTAGALRSLGPVVTGAVSAVDAIVDPGRVAADLARLGQVGQAVTGGTSGTGDIAGATTAIGPAATPSWNCDLSSVVATAGRVQQNAVNAALNLGERAVGGERLGQVTRFGATMRDGVQRAAATVGRGLSSLAAGAGRRLAELSRRVTEPAAAAAAAVRRGFDAVTARASAAVRGAKDGLLRRAAAVKEGAARGITAVLGGARSALAGAASTASRLLGPLGSAIASVLPGWATSFVAGIPGRVTALTARVQGAVHRVTAAAAQAKNTALRLAKSFADAKLQEWAAQKQAAERLLKGAGELAGRAARAVVAAVPDSVKGPLARLAGSARAQAAKFLSAADAVGARIRDGACAVLGATAGPCVTQHLPDLGGGLNNTVRVIAAGDVTVPLEEIGVPANLKIGAGSAVAITARDGTYAVRVTGDATIFLNETVGPEAHVESGGTAPALTGSLAPAWAALAGGATPVPAAAASVAPAAVAPASVASAGGGAVVPGGPAAAAVPGPQVELNAGIRGSTETEWLFDARAAKTSCEGVGGLVTLLTGLGVANALPSPFNQFGPAAVQRGFMKEMTFSRFSAGLAGEVKVDLKTEGIGRLRGRVGGDISENLTTVRDPATGQLVTTRTRTLTGELDATALGPFTAGGLERFALFLEGQGILRLTLGFEGDDIVPTSLGGAIKTTVGARNFDPALVAGLFPPEVAQQVRALLNGALPGLSGPREVTLSLTIGRVYSGLEPLGRELNTYFRGPVDKINVDGVLAIVKRNLPNVTHANHAKLELRATQRRVLAAGASAAEGVAVGANAAVEGEHTVSREWYGFGGTDEVLEAAAARRGPPRAAAVDPKDPDRGKQKPREARMRSQVQEGAIHYGSATVDAADPERGVTAVEFERTMRAARNNAREPVAPGDRRQQMPQRYVPAVDGGHIAQSIRIRERTIPAGGIQPDRIGDINELRVCFDSGSLNPANCSEDDTVRLDVENLAGHNLRFAK